MLIQFYQNLGMLGSEVTSVSSSLSVTDSVDVQVITNPSVSDSLTVTDSAVADIITPSESTLSITDAASCQYIGIDSISSSLSLTDSVTNIVAVSVSDTLTLTQQVDYNASPYIREYITSSQTFTVPDDITGLFIEGTAPGGGSQGASGGGGRPSGGGGAYSNVSINVDPGDSVILVVGTASPGASGTDLTVTHNSSTVLRAKAGTLGGSAQSTIGAGGQASGGVGDVKYSGGDGNIGGIGVNDGYGGGSSASAAGNGNTATGTTGATAPTGGGDGGDGGIESSSTQPQAGQFPGGGAGGSYAHNNVSTAGGGGLIQIHYRLPTEYDIPIDDNLNITQDVVFLSVSSVSDTISLTQDVGEQVIYNNSVTDTIDDLADDIEFAQVFSDSPSDSLSLTDSVVAVNVNNISISDTLTVDHALSEATIYNEAPEDTLDDLADDVDVDVFSFIADTLSLTQTTAINNVYSIPLTEIVAASQELGTAIEYNIAVDDYLVVDDYATALANDELLDTIGVNDSIGILRILNEDISDTLDDLADTINADAIFNNDLSDDIEDLADEVVEIYEAHSDTTQTLMISDTIAEESIYNISITDNIGITQSVSYINGISISQTLSPSDDVGLIGIFNNAVTQNIGQTDAIVAQAIRNVSVTDSIGVADNLSASKIVNVSLSDNLGLTDVASVVADTVISHVIGVTDNLVTATVYNIAVTDTLTPSDELNDFGIVPVNVSDTLNLTQTVATPVIVVNRSITDNIGVTDSVVAQTIYKQTIVQSTAPADTIVFVNASILAVSDSLSLSDSNIFSYNFRPVDSLTLSNTVAVSKVNNQSITQTLTPTNSITAQTIYTESLEHALNLDDTIGLLNQFYNRSYDDLTLTDSAEFYSIFSPTVSDSFTLTHSVECNLVKGVSVTDRLDITQQALYIRDIGIEVCDLIQIRDNVYNAIEISVTDTLDLRDGLIDGIEDYLELSDSVTTNLDNESCSRPGGFAPDSTVEDQLELSDSVVMNWVAFEHPYHDISLLNTVAWRT